MVTYYMPTKIIEGKNLLQQEKAIFAEIGKFPLIVTGQHSAKMSGALEDVVNVLAQEGKIYTLFDQVEENPSIETIIAGAKKGRGCDCVIGIGGGSPIDAAKAIALLMNNTLEEAEKVLLEVHEKEALPLIVIPTTAGTGTETTPYAILTNHKEATKVNFKAKVFPKYALMDVRYFMSMPRQVRNVTCIDAMTHLIESYMSGRSNHYSAYMALEGLRLWGTVKEKLFEESISEGIMTVFMHASTLAGMAIAQTGTSLPHGMGYPLTYHHGIAHGKANGLLMAAYLDHCQDTQRVTRLLAALGFLKLDDFDQYIEKLLGRLAIDEEAIINYSEGMMQNTGKLKNHPDPVTIEDIMEIYKKSILERV